MPSKAVCACGNLGSLACASSGLVFSLFLVFYVLLVTAMPYFELIAPCYRLLFLRAAELIILCGVAAAESLDLKGRPPSLTNSAECVIEVMADCGPPPLDWFDYMREAMSFLWVGVWARRLSRLLLFGLIASSASKVLFFLNFFSSLSSGCTSSVCTAGICDSSVFAAPSPVLSGVELD